MVVNPRSELIREPNLLVPGKKPVGSVKIDWSHPLTDGLVHCFIVTAAGLLDLVSGALYKLPNAQIKVIGDQGHCAVYSTVGDTISLPLRTYPHDVGITQLAIFRQDAQIPNWGKLYIQYSRSTDVNRYRFGFRSEYNKNYGNLNLSANSGPYVLTRNINYFKVNIASAHWGSGLDTDIYYTLSQDGEVYYDQYTGTLSYHTSSIQIDQLTFGDQTYGTISVSMLWGREFTLGEHESLGADPYQFLVPA